MRKLAEVLRLRFELKLSYEQIARSCAIALGSVHKYLKLAQAAGIGWPLPDGWNNERLNSSLFPPKTAAIVEPASPAHRALPDFAALHEQLRSDKNVTLMLLWEEYREAHGSAPVYNYSRFCELYQRWRSKLDVVLRQEHKPGDKMFVDWAGTAAPGWRPGREFWRFELVRAMGFMSDTGRHGRSTRQRSQAIPAIPGPLLGHLVWFHYLVCLYRRGRSPARVFCQQCCSSVLKRANRPNTSVMDRVLRRRCEIARAGTGGRQPSDDARRRARRNDVAGNLLLCVNRAQSAITQAIAGTS